MSEPFDYATAFSRNLGWLTEHEQAILRSKRVAIAGLGGVGGSHLLTLTRLGIGAFNISDLDTFELANFNRQAGAAMSRLGQSKVETLAELALDINPELDLRLFPDGVRAENADDFFADVNLYVDGLDFFAVKARSEIFGACASKSIPATTAAPLGMGTAVLNFLPGGMTFEQYFRLEGHSEEEQLLRFLLGLSPAMLQTGYLVDPTRVDLPNHRGPSTPMACELCAGVAATEALKILLGRGKVVAAPRGLQFDAYRNRLVTTWRPRGNRNPVQRLGLAVARRKFGKVLAQAPAAAPEAAPSSVTEKILDLARWAPSGDNTQPWRFEIKDENHFLVHGADTRDWCVYDLQGRASQLALGTLLESISIAANRFGRRADFSRDAGAPEDRPRFEVRLAVDDSLETDPLWRYLPVRATQRRAMNTRPLTAGQKQTLEASVGDAFSIHWIEGWGARWRTARLLSLNAKLRLTVPEAYRTHSRIIEWDSRFSEDRIPDRAVGLDPVGVGLMRWALKSWGRVDFLNTYLAGTLIPRLQLDLIPGAACGAHFLIVMAEPPAGIDDYIAAGRAWQRFWLSATRLGLWLQPEMTPLIFSSYVREGVAFSESRRSPRLAEELSARLDELLSPEVSQQAVVMGRLGSGPAPAARSVRLPLERLRVN